MPSGVVAVLVGAGRPSAAAGMLHAPGGPCSGLAGLRGTKHGGARPGTSRAALPCEGRGRAEPGSSAQGQAAVSGQVCVWQSLQDSGVAPSGVPWESSPPIFPEAPKQRPLGPAPAWPGLSAVLSAVLLGVVCRPLSPSPSRTERRRDRGFCVARMRGQASTFPNKGVPAELARASRPGPSPPNGAVRSLGERPRLLWHWLPSPFPRAAAGPPGRQRHLAGRSPSPGAGPCALSTNLQPLALRGVWSAALLGDCGCEGLGVGLGDHQFSGGAWRVF